MRAQASAGVVVLGMHRSGTSLATRLINLLGLAVCSHDDLLVGRARNPRGHWESKSLLRLNDRLLAEFGGSWDGPPALGERELARLLGEHRAEALETFARAHPQQPWVWKDPRTCVLLPFWSRVLAERAVYVLVVRHPVEVADSLARRSGFTPLLSLALWERYTRAAMLGAAGRPLLACTYDGVLADPVAWCERLVAFLAEQGLTVGAVDAQAVYTFVMDELRHSEQSWATLEASPDVSQQQARLARLASEPTAQSSYAPPPLGPETPSTAAVLARMARGEGRRGRRARPPASLVRPLAAAAREQSVAVPVSIVLGRVEGAELRARVRALGGKLPAGSEAIVLAGHGGAGGGGAGAREPGSGAAEPDGDAYPPAGELDGVRVRTLACEHEPGPAEALALGAAAASCEAIVLCGGAIERCEHWHARLCEALAVPKIGGVAPVLRLDSSPRARCFGAAFADARLGRRLVEGRAVQSTEPAALLPATLSVYDRALLSAAGGLDGGFASPAAAVAELSVRLWRMGFRCRVVAGVEAWASAGGEEDAPDAVAALHDRLRLATLHFDEQRLRSLLDAVRAEPAFAPAAERLEAGDVRRRRAAIAVVCAFPVERYFERFPFGADGLAGQTAAIPRARGGVLERLRKRVRL